ncbi:MAG: hypothetical protein ACXV4A_08015 [Actinomycetes bacterium]
MNNHHHIHVPEKHQSVMPTPGVLLAYGLVALLLAIIFIAVSLAGHPGS